jgi:hypothetical protein
MSSTRKPKPAKLSKPKAIAKPKSRKAKAPVKSEGQTAPVEGVQTDASSAASTSKPLSGLDAAAIVLREASAPLNAQDLVSLMLERGLWKTEGKTPAATIYAAMIREIRSKGSASRFLKAERGRFAAAG